jgi:pyridoxal phosphate enzyme (YggS family)
MRPADLTTTIADNLQRVRTRIDAAARAAGRDPARVRLIAVSKHQPAAAVAAAVQAGQHVFGESTVQEAVDKIQQLADPALEWHFIGHLQSNKAKFLPGRVHWLHSLTTLSLAERLQRHLAAAGVHLDTLIEVNITRDPHKHGVAPEALEPLLEQLLRTPLPDLRLRGLMAIGPQDGNGRELRMAFAALRRLAEDCAQRYALPDFTELSMGMSGDYAEAIAEGATLVRIGTAIFGTRG